MNAEKNTQPQQSRREVELAARRDEPWLTHIIQCSDGGRPLLNREWLISNGTGAYAMGTAAAVNTRRYHGLLIACLQPPVGRIVALNQMLEQFWLGDPAETKPIELSAGMFRGESGDDVFAPCGHELLHTVERGLCMRWRYENAPLRIMRELRIHWKEQAATLRYVVEGCENLDQPMTVRLSPMLTLRDFHSLMHKAHAGNFITSEHGNVITVRREDIAVTLACTLNDDDTSPRFDDEPQWWYNQHYPVESQRGQDDVEDLFVPGGFVMKLQPTARQEIVITAALGTQAAEPQFDDDERVRVLEPRFEAIRSTFDHEVSSHWKELHVDQPTVALMHRVMAIAADDFIVDRKIGEKTLSSILAGYPWFADWGRDTFIALPGLLLTTGRYDEAKSTLRTFAEAINNGLVPNRFDDYDNRIAAAHYNTVDGSLWFVNAAMKYYHTTQDHESWNNWLCAACNTILNAYIKGTDYDIRMAGDGLISAGNKDTQLTWMDAACQGNIYTPRPGKCVEINALWYHALTGMADLIQKTDSATANHYTKLAKRASRAFVKVFWDDERKYLRDHVWTDAHEEEHIDCSLRPNQIFVAALENSPLPRTKCRLVVKAVREHLLTPYGLRTLPREHPDFHGHYEGPQPQRDEAYHQGTVWPWLIGPYAEAVLRSGKFTREAKHEAFESVRDLLDMLIGVGQHSTLGQLYEIHEAVEPYRPDGCIAQAWSIGELLRVLTLIAENK